MTTLFNVFGKKLFGLKYERLLKALFLGVIIYMGISSAGYTLPIAPMFLYLMSAVVAATMMWQALTASDTASYIKNLVMMPFDNKSFVISYLGALGLYTLVSKVILLWTLVFAICKTGILNIVCAVVSAICGIAIASCVFAFRKLRAVTIIWAAAVAASIFILKDMSPVVMLIVFTVNTLIALVLLTRANGYDLYDASCDSEISKSSVKSHKHNLVWTYFMRYMSSHKNYMFNTVLTWGLAVAIPLFFKFGGTDGDMGKVFMYIGYGVVTFNTPLCILVSCDPDLERGIRNLPDGGKRFFLPYAAFLFVSTGIAYVFYLTSWNITMCGVGIINIVLAVVFALVSSVLSVGAEMFFPLKNWKIESDLWHHPRKYVVPCVVILLGGLAGTLII